MSYCEGFIRDALKQHLGWTNSSKDHRLVEEICIDKGRCRFDVGLVTGESTHGFEIKSDRDTLTRLDHQIESYGRFFEQVSIVAASHWHDAETSTPKWVGILMAGQLRNDQVVWLWMRRPKPSPLFDPASALSIFWAEYLRERIMDIQGTAPPKRWSRARMAEHLASICDRDAIPSEIMRFVDWRQEKLTPSDILA